MATTKNASGPRVLAGYSTEEQLYAYRYKQGGRTVYGVAMSPAQIATLVKRPDPLASNPGNRRIRLDHAQAFARYFIDHEEWVVPGIILRAPSIFKFEQDAEAPGDLQIGTASYPARNQGDIQILDGQHRILGFHLALEMVDVSLDKARSARATARRVEDPVAIKQQDDEIARLERVRDRLFNERVAVEIHIIDDQRAYRQAFFDIAENALGITASVRARFDSRKVVNRALPAILEHPLLSGRVDLEVDRIPRKSPNWLTARHVMEISRVLTVGFDGRVSRRQDRELDEVKIAANASGFLDVLVAAFPVLKAMQVGQVLPDTVRDTSMLGSPLFVRVLAGAYHELTENHGWTKSMVQEYFTSLAKHTNAPAHLNSIWKLHAAPEAFMDNAFGPNGRRQDAKGLVMSIAYWAIDRESFVDEEPKPAPVIEEPDPDDEVDHAPSHDTSRLEIEVRNEVEEIATESKARARSIKK